MVTLSQAGVVVVFLSTHTEKEFKMLCGYTLTAHDGVYHTPWADFSMLDISTVGPVSVPNRPALETSRRELSEDVSSYRSVLAPLLVAEQSSLENRSTVHDD